MRNVLRANCTKITGRRLLSGSCITTRRTLLIPRLSRRCVRNSGSYATFFTRLDSLGVTWLMMDVNTGERLCVIAVTRIGML